MSKFKVGEVYKIIGCRGEIKHGFKKGDKVTLVKIAFDGRNYLYEREDGLKQYVSDKDVKRYGWLKSVFSKILNRF